MISFKILLRQSFFFILCMWPISHGIVFQDESHQQTVHVANTVITTRQKRNGLGRPTVHERKTNANSFVRNELYEAVFIADVDRVHNLLQQDPEILSSRPPVIPDRIDQEEGRAALLVCGLDPQSTNRTKVDNDCAIIAKLLHTAGANMSIVDFNGWDALSMGAVRGYSRYCKYLLKHAKVNPNHVDYQHTTALMKAAGHAHFGAFQVLLKYGADLRLQDVKGQTALHYATRLALANDSYVPFLKKVARVVPRSLLDVPDSNNRTSLMYGAVSNNLQIVKLFLEVGADPRLQDKYYVSVSAMTTDEEIRKLLLEAVAVKVEEEHSTWLKIQMADYDIALESHAQGESEII